MGGTAAVLGMADTIDECVRNQNPLAVECLGMAQGPDAHRHGEGDRAHSAGDGRPLVDPHRSGRPAGVCGASTNCAPTSGSPDPSWPSGSAASSTTGSCPRSPTRSIPAATSTGSPTPASRCRRCWWRSSVGASSTSPAPSRRRPWCTRHAGPSSSRRSGAGPARRPSARPRSGCVAVTAQTPETPVPGRRHGSLLGHRAREAGRRDGAPDRLGHLPLRGLPRRRRDRAGGAGAGRPERLPAPGAAAQRVPHRRPVRQPSL